MNTVRQPLEAPGETDDLKLIYLVYDSDDFSKVYDDWCGQMEILSVTQSRTGAAWLEKGPHLVVAKTFMPSLKAALDMISETCGYCDPKGANVAVPYRDDPSFNQALDELVKKRVQLIKRGVKPDPAALDAHDKLLKDLVPNTALPTRWVIGTWVELTPEEFSAP